MLSINNNNVNCKQWEFNKKSDINYIKVIKDDIEKNLKFYALKNNGIFRKKGVQNIEEISFNFKCVKNHLFKLSWEDIESEKWCPVCIHRLSKLKQIILLNHGKILNFDSCNLTFKVRCKNKHYFETNFNNLKSLKKQFCHECLIKERQFLTQEMKSKQNKLLDYYNDLYKSKNSDVNSFIELTWIKDNWVDNPNDNVSNINLQKFQKIVENYLIKIDEKTLISCLKTKNESKVKTWFRKCCILVHPDKNNNPIAKQLFLKLIKCYKSL